MINIFRHSQSGKKSLHRSRERLAVIATLLLVLGTVGIVKISAATNSQIKTVFVVMMENTDWSQVKGSPNYPYLNNTLLPNSAYANNYIGGIGHPSLPNYVTLEAGDPMGLTDGSYLPPAQSTNTTDHLTTQLRAAGISWKYYAENLPGNGTTCNVTDPGTPYSLDHDPFVYFDDVRNDVAYCQSHERPYSEFATDLTNNTAPNYNFIVPNDWDQGEKLAPGSNCMACQADNFLKLEIPKIQASAAYNNGGLIIVLWDENGYTGNYASGMIMNSPLAKKNYSNNIAYNHGSTLRTMQTIFGVGPFLRMASTATDMADFFTVALTGATTTTPTPTATPAPTPTATSTATPTPTPTPTPTTRCKHHRHCPH
ncbi:UNVERIFIED_ORG: phospholipase C [Arthrobacter sp. UYEF2]